MKCWSCGKDTMVKNKTGDGSICECGATDNRVEESTASSKSTTPRRVAKSPNGVLSLSLPPTLKERLEDAAKKRNLTAEEYAITILNREAGRKHYVTKVVAK